MMDDWKVVEMDDQLAVEMEHYQDLILVDYLVSQLVVNLDNWMVDVLVDCLDSMMVETLVS